MTLTERTSCRLVVVPTLLVRILFSFCHQVKLAGNKGLDKEVKADLSRTHFTLGNHKFDWETDAMRTQVRHR